MNNQKTSNIIRFCLKRRWKRAIGWPHISNNGQIFKLGQGCRPVGRGGCEGCTRTPHRQLRSTFLLKNGVQGKKDFLDRRQVSGVIFDIQQRSLLIVLISSMLNCIILDSFCIVKVSNFLRGPKIIFGHIQSEIF